MAGAGARRRRSTPTILATTVIQRKEMQQSRTELSWAKAALPRLLHLLDNEQIGPDCRWPPEREAKMPRSCLPLNGRDAREEDDLDMARWHANISASHDRLRALGEAARMSAQTRPPIAPRTTGSR
jgi:hypothetical protein